MSLFTQKMKMLTAIVLDGYSDKAALPHSVTAGGFDDGHV